MRKVVLKETCFVVRQAYKNNSRRQTYRNSPYHTDSPMSGIDFVRLIVKYVR